MLEFLPISLVYEGNEKEKDDEYLERVLNVEKTTFSLHPAVFITSEGMSKECKQSVSRLADLKAREKEENHCDVVRHLRIIKTLYEVTESRKRT